MAVRMSIYYGPRD